MQVDEIPQFVTITFDDGIDSNRIELYKKFLFSAHDKRDCPPRFTCFTSFDWSQCEAIQYLLNTGMVEFAHHTQSHAVLPNASDIQAGIQSLVACGVPRSHITGFRTPYLTYDETVLDHIYASQAVYDATVMPHDDALTGYGRHNQWPFTLEQGWTYSKVKCGRTGNCTEGKSYPGLWEIPLYPWYDTNDRFLDNMDYTTFDKDVQQNFERRYTGNRAPFGIYLHAPWLETHGSKLQKWIQQTMDTYDDVYFVANMNLIEWMRNPVPKSVYVPPSCQTKPCHSNDCNDTQTNDSGLAPLDVLKAPAYELLKFKVTTENNDPLNNSSSSFIDEPPTHDHLSKLPMPIQEILFLSFLGPLLLFLFVSCVRIRHDKDYNNPQDDVVTDVERLPYKLL